LDQQWEINKPMMWLVYSILSLGLTIGLHGLLARIQSGGNRLAQFVYCSLAGATLLLASLIRPVPHQPLDMTAAVCIFAFGCELYVFSFTFVISSVAASLLIGGSVPPFASSNEMVHERLRRMMATGLLSKDGEAVRLTRKGRAFVMMFRALRAFFGHETVPEFAPGKSSEDKNANI
jgi:hypothetical protein